MNFRERLIVNRPRPADVITGTDDDDTLIGTDGKDMIEGLLGDDVLQGLGGKDRLEGGKGNDTLAGGRGRDRLVGGAGDDVFRFESVADSRPDKADVITVYEGLDRIDTRQIDADKTTPGDQKFSYVAALTGAAGELAWMSNGAGGTIVEGDVDGDGLVDFRIEIEDDRRDSLAGTDGNDTLIGYDEGETIGSGDSFTDNGWDTMLGGGGNDSIQGGNGIDSLDGGAGDDTIVGGGDVDRITGGDGNDLIWGLDDDGATSSSFPDDIDGGPGNDTIHSVARSTITGGAGDDLILAMGFITSLPVSLAGGSGDDTISVSSGSASYEILGETGDDVLSGIFGDDTLFGGDGSDALFGEQGFDLLVGGAGGDTLDGGRQPDIYLYEQLADSTLADPDLLSKLAPVDTIDLSPIDANTSQNGDQAFKLAADFTGAAGELRLRLDGSSGDTFIEGDVDGDALADFRIVANGDHADFTSFVL